MSEPTTVIPVGELIARRLDEHIIEPFFKFLRRRSPTTRHLLGLVAVAVLVGSAIWSIWSLHSYSRLMAPILAQELETNDMPYKGVEAFLLSAIPDEAKGYWGPGLDPIDIRNRCSSLSAASWPPDASFTTRYQGPSGGENPSEHTSYAVGWSQSTDTEKQSFLFLPDIFLPSLGTDKAGPNGSDLNQWVRRRAEQNPDIQREIAAAAGAGSILEEMDDRSIDDMSIVQSYFIGDLGTLAMRDNAHRTASGFNDRFSTTKYFAARPYFYRAFDAKHKRGYFDYVSPAYIDYAGNGVVRTYTIAVKLGNGHHALLAFDCAVRDGEEQLIKRALELQPPWKKLPWPVEADHTERFEVAVDPISQELEVQGTAPEWFRELVVQRSRQAGKGELMGLISARPPSEGEDAYEFVVPLGAERAGRHGLDWTRFTVVRVDLNDMKRVWIPGALCILACFVFGGFLNYFYHEHIAERRAQEKVLRNVARVMRDASTPFAWFDGANRFVDANLSMARWLGYKTVRDLKLSPGGSRRTFRELLSAADRMPYEVMLEASQKGRPSNAYWCALQRADGEYIDVLAHGERMPLEFRHSGRIPHRFGVLLKRREKGDLGKKHPGEEGV